MEIRDVAIYLRKSRGEEETDLEKHRHVLVQLATKNNWRYIEYVEIANSETIEFRPKFKQLLKDVENDMFDAVVVIDYDRLGRGDLEDQAVVKRIFRDSETFIVTPEKIYNLSDDSDDLMVDVKGLLARQEYKSIKKRLLRGKKIGARLGNWTNGRPPFPYKYSSERKGLLVDENKRDVYLRMKEMFLDGKPCYEIAWSLNNEGIPSPKGGLWHENTIRRVLLDETHLGMIITNKTQGGLHKKKKASPFKVIPREEWIIVRNCHEELKNEDEHNKIIALFAKRKIVPLAARSGKYILSGLVFCGKCGFSLQFLKKPNGKVYVKKCQRSDPFGHRCDNRGLDTNYLFEAVNTELEDYESSLIEMRKENPTSESMRLDEILRNKMMEIDKAKKALERVKEIYEDGDYSKEEYTKRKIKRETEIYDLETEINETKRVLDYNKKITIEEKIARIHRLREIWESDVDSSIKNRIASEVIEKIAYIRNDEESTIEIQVQFR